MAARCCAFAPPAEPTLPVDGIGLVLLLPALLLCAWLHRHIRKELEQLAIEGQQRAAQLLGQHHELGVVAGALVA